MLSRRGLLGALLAAPVVIRIPGLLMPIKPERFRGFSTDDMILHCTERYSVGWADFRGMWGGNVGDIAGFDFRGDSVELAVRRMKELRLLEAEIADRFADARR